MDKLKEHVRTNRRDGRLVSRYVFILKDVITLSIKEGYTIKEIYRSIGDSSMKFSTFRNAVNRVLGKVKMEDQHYSEPAPTSEQQSDSSYFFPSDKTENKVTESSIAEYEKSFDSKFLN